MKKMLKKQKKVISDMYAGKYPRGKTNRFAWLGDYYNSVELINSTRIQECTGRVLAYS